jgi:hypothetical protein
MNGIAADLLKLNMSSIERLHVRQAGLLSMFNLFANTPRFCFRTGFPLRSALLRVLQHCAATRLDRAAANKFLDLRLEEEEEEEDIIGKKRLP